MGDMGARCGTGSGCAGVEMKGIHCERDATVDRLDVCIECIKGAVGVERILCEQREMARANSGAGCGRTCGCWFGSMAHINLTVGVGVMQLAITHSSARGRSSISQLSSVRVRTVCSVPGAHVCCGRNYNATSA